MLQCEHCDKEFKFKSEKNRHELSHFTVHECEICEKKFNFISSLRRHQKQHLRKSNVQCDKCSRNFKDETLLHRHVQYAHNGNFPCNECKAVFHSELALKSHAKCHSMDSQKKYVCKYFGCSKKFNYKHHLQHHELAHTGTKQHYCNVCGKGFIQSSHLKSHLKLHEPSKNWLKCPVDNCNKEFPTQYARKRHLKTHKFHYEKNMSCDSVLGDQIVNNAEHTSENNVAEENIMFKDIPKNENETKITKECNSNIGKYNITDTVNACTSVLGGCLVTGNNEFSKDCLCAQMDIKSKNVEDSLSIDEAIRESKLISNVGNINCDGCECSGNKVQNNLIDTNIKTPNQKCNKNKDMPIIEYGSNGIVKLKETFDIYIEYQNLDGKFSCRDINSKESFMFNSCKDVLGKCIVSGDGLMSEGCLCAKMGANEDQLIAAQEADEITPCPNEDHMIHLL